MGPNALRKCDIQRAPLVKLHKKVLLNWFRLSKGAFRGLGDLALSFFNQKNFIVARGRQSSNCVTFFGVVVMFCKSRQPIEVNSFEMEFMSRHCILAL